MRVKTYDEILEELIQHIDTCSKKSIIELYGVAKNKNIVIIDNETIQVYDNKTNRNAS